MTLRWCLPEAYRAGTTAPQSHLILGLYHCLLPHPHSRWEVKAAGRGEVCVPLSVFSSLRPAGGQVEALGQEVVLLISSGPGKPMMANF